jgi:RNA polymerase sigma factor (TIGR02999 family)
VAVPPTPDVTQLLLAWRNGNRAALDTLVPLVHAELRRLVHRYMLGERHSQPLRTTTLVNEVCLRLVEPERVRRQHRTHFHAICAPLVRRILVDTARSRASLKGVREVFHLELDEAAVVSKEPEADLVALDEALQKLAAIDARKSQIVELRYFAGMTVEETAEALDVSPETVMRDGKLAKLFLLREVRRGLSIEPTG